MKNNRENEINLIIEDIKRKFEKIFYINIQNFSVNGCAQYNGEKCFFKIVDEELFIKELNGYLISHKEIPIMQMLFVKQLFNSKKYLLAYMYDSSINKDDGLLNDVLVRNDLSKKINQVDVKRLHKVLKIYQKIYNGKKKMLSYCPSNIFFSERVDARLKPWYKDLINSKIKIEVKNKTYNISKIINETIKYFENNKETSYECILSQGDPNTLNISVSPNFFDLVTAGYNPIIGELAITLISTLIYDSYFCPKYHENSYYLHDKAREQLNYFKPNIVIEENDKKIKIKSNIKTSIIRKRYMKSYIKILKGANINMTCDIIYYIVMRLLCVFNINKMSKEDYYYSLYMICYFYNSISGSQNVYKTLEKIIDEMGDVRNEK